MKLIIFGSCGATTIPALGVSVESKEALAFGVEVCFVFFQSIVAVAVTIIAKTAASPSIFEA